MGEGNEGGIVNAHFSFPILACRMTIERTERERCAVVHVGPCKWPA